MVEKLIYIREATLQDGEFSGHQVEDQWILIVKYQGQYYGLDDACSHSGYPLHKGNLSPDGILTCPLHEAQFECQTGKIVSDPPLGDDQSKVPIQVKDGKVYWVKNGK